MTSFNRVILVGNLTREVEVKYLQSGTAVAEIGLAINERVKKNEEWIDVTTFVDITLWARTAEVAGEYLKKGSSVLIEGRLKFDQWLSDGEKRSKLSVTGDKMQMLGGKSDKQQSQPAQQSQSSGQPQSSGSKPPEDDIPF